MWSRGRRSSLRSALSASDVETLQAAYEAFARGDVEALVSMCDTDIEVHEEPELPDSRTWHGHEGARQYFAEGQARWSEFDAQPSEFRVLDDATIVVLGVERGRGSLSGADVESEFGHVYRFQRGRIVSARFYFDQTRALDAAGAP